MLPILCCAVSTRAQPQVPAFHQGNHSGNMSQQLQPSPESAAGHQAESLNARWSGSQQQLYEVPAALLRLSYPFILLLKQVCASTCMPSGKLQAQQQEGRAFCPLHESELLKLMKIRCWLQQHCAVAGAVPAPGCIFLKNQQQLPIWCVAQHVGRPLQTPTMVCTHQNGPSWWPLITRLTSVCMMPAKALCLMQPFGTSLAAHVTCEGASFMQACAPYQPQPQGPASGRC